MVLALKQTMSNHFANTNAILYNSVYCLYEWNYCTCIMYDLAEYLYAVLAAVYRRVKYFRCY